MKFLIVFSVSLLVIFIVYKIVSALPRAGKKNDEIRGYVIAVDASQQRITIDAPGRIIACRGSAEMCRICESSKDKKAVFKFEVTDSGEYNIIEMNPEK